VGVGDSPGSKKKKKLLHTSIYVVLEYTVNFIINFQTKHSINKCYNLDIYFTELYI
jgi:hypothetical protein